MRKIVSIREREKKRRLKQLIGGGFLIFILFFSILGYSFQSREKKNIEELNYNTLSFVKQGDFWIVRIRKQNFGFKYNPKETESFSSFSKIKNLENYRAKPLYIYSENKDAESEIYRNLYPVIQRVQSACLENKSELNLTCSEEWPIKTCEDNFIILKEDKNYGISQKDNCVFILGPQDNLTQITDEFLFKVLEIKQ
jgi:hypothetical protein